MSKIGAAFLSLLNKHGLRPMPAASEVEIAQFEKKNTFKVPKEVRELLAVSSGLVLKSNRFRFLTLPEAQVWLESWGLDHPRRWAFLPVADDFEENPFCISCKGPLKGMVVRVFHDDESRLQWRSLASWLDWLASLETDDDWNSLEKPADFASPKRTKKDLSASAKLQAIDEFASDIDEADVGRFLLTLVSEECIPLFREKLESDNIYNREAAEAALRKMTSLEAKKVIADYDRGMHEYADQCAAFLANDPHQISGKLLYPGTWGVFEILRGSMRVGMTFSHFYARRHSPTALSDLLESVYIALRIPSPSISERGIRRIVDELEGADANKRHQAEQQLRQIDTPLCREAVAAHRARLREFGQRCEAYLIAHGFAATFQSRDETAESPLLEVIQAEKTQRVYLPKYYILRDSEYLWRNLIDDINTLFARMK